MMWIGGEFNHKYEMVLNLKITLALCELFKDSF